MKTIKSLIIFHGYCNVQLGIYRKETAFKNLPPMIFKQAMKNYVKRYDFSNAHFVQISRKEFSCSKIMNKDL